jgi:hypothetical protein
LKHNSERQSVPCLREKRRKYNLFMNEEKIFPRGEGKPLLGKIEKTSGR